MQLPLDLDVRARQGLQEQLFEQLLGLIADGRLKSGMQMPTTRQLAMDLAISRNTVVLAYDRLMAEGFIEMRRPVGTFVTGRGADTLVAPARQAVRVEPGFGGDVTDRPATRFAGSLHALRSPHAASLRFDFWVGRPDARLFPASSWRKLVEQSLADMQHGDGGYGEPAGLHALRAAVANHVGATRGVICDAAGVVITNGIQEGINIASRLLLAPGVAVGIENPGYLGAANAFASYGARLIPVDLDDDGAVVGTLPPECRLAYLTPAHQYPTGVAMSLERRRAWLRWARTHGGYLIEDDYDSDFYYDGVPLPAVKAGDDAGSVIYLGTFSKSLAAGMRVGYMVVPPALLAAAITVKGLMTSGSPWLMQATLAAFLDSGEYAHHLRRLRKLYAARRDTLIGGLMRHFGADGHVTGSQAGMHVLWHTPARLPSAAQIETRAQRAGVGVYSLASGNTSLDDGMVPVPWQRGLMLGFAALDEHEIDEGLSQLAAALG